MPLPPLYFMDKPGQQLPQSSSSQQQQLPPELLATILNEFLSYNDLARLACVQDAWKNVLYDSTGNVPAAQWELACALLEGTHGLASNPSAALGLLEQLANNDTPTEYTSRAMQRLGHYHLQHPDTTTPAPHTTGLAWLQRAYTQCGDANAAYDVAILYEYGRSHVPVDVVAAAEWFQTAATAGHTEAMAELGLCFELGCGVEVDDARALEWYMKAAEGGHVTAKYSVAEAFEEARGVPQSDAEACRWYYRAALAGDEDSLRALRRLEDIARIAIPGVAVLLDG